ncbi:MAG: hypothetical protein F4X98_14985 [Gammaproteobacteria bacterium]|nr:hypothetical protein [Gammaproteobacteria bacterium]
MDEIMGALRRSAARLNELEAARQEVGAAGDEGHEKAVQDAVRWRESAANKALQRAAELLLTAKLDVAMIDPDDLIQPEDFIRKRQALARNPGNWPTVETDPRAAGRLADALTWWASAIANLDSAALGGAYAVDLAAALVEGNGEKAHEYLIARRAFPLARTDLRIIEGVLRALAPMFQRETANLDDKAAVLAEILADASVV